MYVGYLGNHIIAADRLGVPSTYREILEILSEKEIIPQDYFVEIKGMAGFRNILIHEYLKVEPALVYDNLQKAPGQFRQFITYISKYLD